jgi:hypothetical protein
MMKPDDKEILRKNPHLDPKRIAELEAFQARMEDAGVDFKTKYLVEPAFGTLASFARRR